MQQSAAGDDEFVDAAFVGFHPQRDVFFQFVHEPFAKLAAGDILPVAAHVWRIIDAEEHVKRRFVDADRRQRRTVFDVHNAIADVHAFDADHGGDVTRAEFRAFGPAQAIEFEQLLDVRLAALAVALNQGDALVLTNLAGEDSADADATDEFAVVDRHHLHLQRRAEIDVGTWHLVENGFVKRLEIDRFLIEVQRGHAVASRGVNGRKIKRLVVGVEFNEEVEDQVLHLGDAGIGPVNLVDDDDRLQSAGKGFSQHEAGLRQRSFGGVDEQKCPVGHFQHALDLAAEVGVARRVDQVHFHVADRESDILGQNRDAALAFQWVGIDNETVLAAGESVEFLPAKQTGLAQHVVDQGGLAMVDVGNNRHIP